MGEAADQINSEDAVAALTIPELRVPQARSQILVQDRLPSRPRPRLHGFALSIERIPIPAAALLMKKAG
jgi:hypothetical protein